MTSTLIQRRAQLHAIKTIPHPRLISARNEILALHQVSRLTDDPGCVAIIGDTGSGKTTLVKAVCDRINASAQKGREPAIYFELPEVTSRKALVGRMLEATGDIDPYGSPEPVLLSRFADVVPARGVEIIIADELQHLVSKKNRAVNEKGADLLKVTIDRVRRPFVLVGNMDIDLILEANEQLQRRVHSRIDLNPFNYEDEKERRQFQAFLRLYDARLPFPDWCELEDDALSEAMHVATRGLIGFFVQLVKKAGAIALEEDARRIEPAYWATAWRGLRKRFVTDSRNPFAGLELPAPRPKLEAELKRLKAA